MFHFIWKHEEFLSIKNHRPKPFIIAKDIIKSGKPEEVQIRDIRAHEQHDFSNSFTGTKEYRINNQHNYRSHFGRHPPRGRNLLIQICHRSQR